jgi:hypothetical protein
MAAAEMVGAAATAAVLAINSPLANPATLLQKASGASIRPEAFLLVKD